MIEGDRADSDNAPTIETGAAAWTGTSPSAASRAPSSSVRRDRLGDARSPPASIRAPVISIIRSAAMPIRPVRRSSRDFSAQGRPARRGLHYLTSAICRAPRPGRASRQAAPGPSTGRRLRRGAGSGPGRRGGRRDPTHCQPQGRAGHLFSPSGKKGRRYEARSCLRRARRRDAGGKGSAGSQFRRDRRDR